MLKTHNLRVFASNKLRSIMYFSVSYSASDISGDTAESNSISSQYADSNTDWERLLKPFDLEELRDSFNKVTPYQLNKLLELPLDVPTSMELFQWAGCQKGYHHSFDVYYTLIDKVGSTKEFKIIESLLLQMKEEGIVFRESVFIMIMRHYGKASLPGQATRLLLDMKSTFLCEPTFRSYNVVLDVLLTGNCPKVAPNVIYEMLNKRIPPTVFTFGRVIKALCMVNEVDSGHSLLRDMTKHGCVPNAIIYQTLIHALSGANRVNDALTLLEEMFLMGCTPDVSTFNDVIIGLCNVDRIHEASSFRKRSARHRVLSNTIISESPSSAADKESPVSTTSSYQPQPNLTIPEKTSVIKWTEEKTEVSPEPLPKVSGDTVARKDECIEDAAVDESNIIVIQATLRGFLARRLLLKQKNVIKLQAAVRGHLVRKHAVGTLRCVQAIVKMQGLVRARRAPPCVGGSGNSNQDLIHSRKSGIKPNEASIHVSIDKLLSNRFARQLMDSTPKNEPINIKCDPLKSDSAWKWLERWMAASSPVDEEPHESGSDEKENNENVHESRSDEKKNLEYSEPQGEKDISAPSDSYCNSINLKTSVSELAKASEIDDLVSFNAKSFDPISAIPASAHPTVQDIEESNSTHNTNESFPTDTIEPEVISSGLEAKSLIDKEESKSEEDLPDSGDSSIEQRETEVKTLSRKASNPSFIAAQSKFEELSSGGTCAKLTTASSLDREDESTLEHVSSLSNQPIISNELGFVDNSISNASAVQIIGSECGTELSISSTLDSPDRSEVEVNYAEQEPKASGIFVHPSNGENKELAVNGTCSLPETDLSHTIAVQLEKDESFKSAHGSFSLLGTDLSHSNIQQLERDENITCEPNTSLTHVGLPEVEEKTEADHATNVHLELESEVIHPVDQLSPEGSPRSQITVPESQATPSSQVSVQTKKSRGEKSRSNQKGRYSSADRKSESTPNNDSGSRKSGKRRNSFGSVKPDQSDQEPRDSSSSISVPSYMQATESARAKAIANGSPRSSPDVHDKDIFIKKRQSLPVANGRQGSPRIERSLSQAQQTAKANGTSSPQDRKWKR